MFVEAVLTMALSGAQAQLTADCAKPVEPTDQIVCADQRLVSLDAELKALVASAPPKRLGGSTLVEAQGAWLQRRNDCAKRADGDACAEGAYVERIRVLTSLANPVTADAQVARCSGVASGAYRAQFYGTRLVLYSLDGEPLASALPAKSRAPWAPFLAYDMSPNGFRLKGADGRSGRCAWNS